MGHDWKRTTTSIVLGVGIEERREPLWMCYGCGIARTLLMDASHCDAEPITEQKTSDVLIKKLRVLNRCIEPEAMERTQKVLDDMNNFGWELVCADSGKLYFKKTVWE